MSDKEIALELTKLSVDLFRDKLFEGQFVDDFKSNDVNSSEEVNIVFNFHLKSLQKN